MSSALFISCRIAGFVWYWWYDMAGGRGVAWWEGDDVIFPDPDLGQPKDVVKSVVPAWNSMVFFDVNAVSFHQVRAECLVHGCPNVSTCVLTEKWFALNDILAYILVSWKISSCPERSRAIATCRLSWWYHFVSRFLKFSLPIRHASPSMAGSMALLHHAPFLTSHSHFLSIRQPI